jgi:hypothetical protein
MGRSALSTFTVAGCLFAASAALAGPMPYSKPGLWTVTQKSASARAPTTSKLCIDKATQTYLTDMGKTAGEICSRHDVSGMGSKVEINSVCSFGPTTLTSHAVMTFQGDSAFHETVDGQFSPAFMGKSRTHTDVSGAWGGACPPGLAPGDMQMTVGGRSMKMHMGPGGMTPAR